MNYIKIEIVVSHTYLQPLTQLLEESGAQGYTVLDIFRSKGKRRGEQISEGVLPVTRNMLVFSVVPRDHAVNIVQRVEPYVEELGGMLITQALEHVSELR